MGHACGGSAVRTDQQPARGTQSATPLGQRTEYERYMQTVALLSLQPREDMVAHPDEILFAGIHQIHELLLKLASRERVTAASQLFAGDDPDRMSVSVTRTSRIAGLLTGTRAVLEDMTPEGGSSGRSRGTAG
jgi:tryptophan 2,3-dioxygenase